jgi:hypothetical protein
MPEDPLYHSIVESTQVLTTVLTRLEDTHRFALRLQTYALTLLGGMLLLFGYVIWQHFTQGQAHAALIEALRSSTQTAAAQTQALLEALQRLPKP